MKDHREVKLLEEHVLHMGCVEFEVKEGHPGEDVSYEISEPFLWM